MKPTPSPAAPDGPMLSVVVPAYDEAPNLERLLSEVRAALDPTGLAWELIVVDDGSGDETPAILARLAAAEPRLRPLRQPTRSGQTAALVTGFHAARGALIATLDADLQCPPGELPALLADLGDADLACGIRAHRHDPAARRLASALTNLARRAILAPRVRDLACPLRVFRADALRRVEAMTPLFDGAHRWLPALFALAGQRVVQRPVAHLPRRAGVSKYTTTGRAGPIARELIRVLGLAIPRSRGLRIGIALAAAAVVLVPFLYDLGRWPLLEPDEGRNAEVAREMLAVGTWGVPHFDYLPYLDKPVLLFWLMATAFRTLGVSELAARLPSALAALATVALTFALGRALLPGVRRALLAAVVLTTSPLVLAFGRLAIFDMPLTALATAALICLVLARLRGEPWRWWPLAGLAMGFGVLCKGPVGLAVPLLAWVAGRGALPPAPRRAGVRPALAAALLTAAVIVPWLAHVEWRHPGFLRYAVVDETLLRFTSAARFERAGPGYYYAPVLAWAGGVWSVLLLAVTPTLVRRARAGGADGAAIRFAARAAAAIVLLFTCSASKRPQYVLPALVPLALLAAIGLDAAPRLAARVLRALAVALAAVGLGAVAVALAGVRLPAVTLPVMTPGVLVAAGAFLLGWGIVTLRAARRPALALACAALLAPGLGAVLLGPLASYARSRSSRQLATQIPAGATVVCAETFRTSLPFYLGRRVLLASRRGHELTSNYVAARHERFRDHGTLLPTSGLAEVIARDARVVVLTSPWRLAAVEQLTRTRFERVYGDRRSVLLRPAS
ncbi:MAG TPA: glycosyltransferase [Candidatus Binatia bacterium]|nr:glycosyltransferase [Candidatus Binatia bacterium]